MCVCRTVRVRTIALADADLSRNIPGSDVVLQTTLGHILEAFGAQAPEGFRDMEVGISRAGRTTLPLFSLWRFIHREGMDK